jgi:Transposase
MTGTRKQYSAAFKARVALEAAKSTRTLAELSRAFQVHPVQVSQWKRRPVSRWAGRFRVVVARLRPSRRAAGWRPRRAQWLRDHNCRRRRTGGCRPD